MVRTNESIVECVPNFSEGRNMDVIRQIADAIASVEAVKLLNVDAGRDTNRTVVTFVGPPQAVIEAAFEGAKAATELIDMRNHKGEHPRFGAIDVLPLIPISGITMAEVAILARDLARRIGEELGISVFCYEKSAASEQRRNLADVRHGEYEGLKDKLADPAWKPDFGPVVLNERAGAVAVGARSFLIAYNVNLNTTSTRRANAIAFDVREKGRPKREGGRPAGKIVVDHTGEPIWEPGTLTAVKAIGWFIEEYGLAQVSMNLTDVERTPLHVAFDEVCAKAADRGIRVTGSELVGLVPLQTMLDAGKHFLRKQQRSLGLPDREIVRIAVKTMGLDELRPFDPDERIIEYAMKRGETAGKLAALTVRMFVEETASESVAPGGGSVSALVGALGAALGTMVANLSAHKRGWDDRWEEFSAWAEQGKASAEELLALVDADTDAYLGLTSAFGMPRDTDEQVASRKEAIQTATQRAIEVPLAVMEASLKSLDVIVVMSKTGNPNSASDAGVGALCARAAIAGAFLNVRINTSGLLDKELADRFVARGHEISRAADRLTAEALAAVESKL